MYAYFRGGIHVCLRKTASLEYSARICEPSDTASFQLHSNMKIRLRYRRLNDGAVNDSAVNDGACWRWFYLGGIA